MTKRHKTDAMIRANDLFCNTPTNQLPKLALAYMRKMSLIYGACSEVALTAIAHYVQLEEGLPCKNPLYRPKKKDKALFAEVKASLAN